METLQRKYERLVGLIEWLDKYHYRYLMTNYYVTTLICYGSYSIFGDYLKSMPKYHTTRKYEVCYSFAKDILHFLSQHNVADKDTGRQFPPSFCKKLLPYLQKNY